MMNTRKTIFGLFIGLCFSVFHVAKAADVADDYGHVSFSEPRDRLAAVKFIEQKCPNLLRQNSDFQLRMMANTPLSAIVFHVSHGDVVSITTLFSVELAKDKFLHIQPCGNLLPYNISKLKERIGSL